MVSLLINELISVNFQLAECNVIPLKEVFSSSVGRKYIMALTGIGLTGFVVTHLIGNLTLLDPQGEAFNNYANALHKLGWLLLVAEVGLLFAFLVHIFLAFNLTGSYKSARPEKYAVWKSKNLVRTSNSSSRNMIITGVLLLVFLVYHVWQFRFGPGAPEGYLVEINGEEARDLYRLVREKFYDPIHVGLYTVAMVFLFLHLRHGFWSAFQSLGLTYPRYTKIIHGFAFLFAALLAIGFLFLPLALYFDLPGAFQ